MVLAAAMGGFPAKKSVALVRRFLNSWAVFAAQKESQSPFRVAFDPAESITADARTVAGPRVVLEDERLAVATASRPANRWFVYYDGEREPSRQSFSKSCGFPLRMPTSRPSGASERLGLPLW
jgi:hypothetical protein